MKASPPPPRENPETGPPTPPEATWLLTFTSDDPAAPDGDGRPWGDGTSMGARARSGQHPWDAGCSVRPMVGGFETFNAICETFEAAIADASARTVPAGRSKGHVYITGLQLNALRDLSQNQTWKGQAWDTKATVERDQTVLGFVLRMMAAGIDVRLLLWMPTTAQASAAGGFGPLAAEHWSIAAAVQDFDDELDAPPGRGVVALDLRTAGPTGAALHQKLVVVRVGAVDVAYCGGIDLAFSRRDFGRVHNLPAGGGDWQSGDTTPLADAGWPRQKGLDYPKSFPVWTTGRFPEDLPANVYGTGNRCWHDQHLELRGPIVTTLEQQFAERWVQDTRVFKFDRSASAIGRDNQVQVTHTTPDGGMWPLPPAAPAAPAGDATVQMWRTIPLRPDVAKGPLRRGEFTIMAGVANAVAQATELITIWDQYFWSEPLARLLAARLEATPTLRLLIVLPPYGTTHVSDELALRKAALQTLWKDLGSKEARDRVKVFGLWNTNGNVGIYVHAKVQTYDDMLLVCGSANMNRRSFECDAELDCAVLHRPTVRAHLQALHHCVMAQGGAQSGYEVRPGHEDQVGPLPVGSWEDFGKGWLGGYWDAMQLPRPRSRGALVEDPFFKENPGSPKTPNGVDMPSTRGTIPYSIFEPSSIRDGIGEAVCQHGIPGDPNAPGRLDELTFLIERCHDGGRWPWRVPTPSW